MVLSCPQPFSPSPVTSGSHHSYSAGLAAFLWTPVGGLDADGDILDLGVIDIQSNSLEVWQLICLFGFFLLLFVLFPPPTGTALDI